MSCLTLLPGACCLPYCALQMPAPQYLYAPLMNFVGYNSTAPTSIPAYKWYTEGINAPVFPRDLYAAQLLARIGSIPAVGSGAGQVMYVSPGHACDGWTRCLVGTSNATMPRCNATYTCEYARFEDGLRASNS